MIGIEVTLDNGSKVLGVIFPDDTVYVHEPISDTYDSQEDLLDDYTGASIQVLGTIMPLEQALKMLDDNHEKNLQALEAIRQHMITTHAYAVANLKKYISDSEGAA